MGRSRLEAFSDGVFAVAITLLALDLAVAGPGHGALLHQVTEHWPSFVAYLISFFTIGIIWVNHHAVLANIATVDRSLLYLNLVLLLFVVVIPFTTATMAEYLTLGGEDARVAMVLYAVSLEGMGLSFGAIFEWTLRSDRLHRPIAATARRAARLRFSIGAVLYLAAIVVAFVSPSVALVIIVAAAVYYIFERTPAVDPAPEAPRDSGAAGASVRRGRTGRQGGRRRAHGRTPPA